MKISIIIPVYNGENTIKECLESVSDQTFKDYEIIVVNSSNDNTQDIIKKDFPNIKLIHLNKKTFPGAARNIGIKKAKGKIIAFTDADCVVSKDWLENIFEQQKFYDIVGGCTKNGNPGIISWVSYLSEFNNVLPTMKEKYIDHLPTCNISYKKNLFKGKSFPEDFFAGEDRILNKNMVEVGLKIFFTPKIKIKHINRNKLKKFLLHQFAYGRDSAYIHKTFNCGNNFLIKAEYKPKFPFVLFFPIGKFLTVSLRILKNGSIYFPLFIVLLPLYFMGLSAFTLGFAKEGSK